jgi:hypothetical protein
VGLRRSRRTALSKQFDMTRMKKVEASVGEPDAQSIRLPYRDDSRGLLIEDNLVVASTCWRLQRVRQFVRKNDGRTPLANRQASGGIC